MSDTKLRLLKRLKHNADKIKEPTIKKLLQDAYHFVFNSEDTPSDLQTKLDEALKGQIAVFEEDDWPHFRQGAPSHELERLFTAEDAARLVATIKEAKADEEERDYEEANPPVDDKDALKGMTVLMERAGFMGIIWEYMTAKSKFHERITPQRVDGRITAFDVELQDGTTVTLRNPECVDPDQVVPTSVTAGVTKTDQKD